MIKTDPSTSAGIPVGSPHLLAGAKRLLIVRLRNLGDCILSTPVIRALKDWNPSLHITLLVEQPFAGVFRGNPGIDHMEILARSGSWWHRYRDRWHCTRRLQQGGYDCVWNLHGGSTSLYLTLAAHAPVRIGFVHYRRPSAYTHLVPAAADIWGKSPVHTVETQLAPLKWLGIVERAESFSPEIFTTPQAKEQADRFLDKIHLSHRPFLLIQPTATLRTKQWPEERFSRLIDHIRNKSDLAVVLSAGPGEEDIARRVLRHQRDPIPVYQGTDLEEFKAILQRSHCFIGNDSGPMHLAAALHRPVLAIFSSSNYDAWHPWGTTFEAVRTDLSCSPCPGYRCYRYESPRCVEGITEEQVWQSLQRLLGRIARQN